MKMFARGLAALALAAATAVSAASAEMREINWGLLAVESQDNLMKRWGPIVKAMEAKTGMKINPFFATDYTGVIEAMRFNKVDLVLFGNKSAMTAVDRAGAEVFAQMIETDGSKGYYSILVAHKDNETINSLDDVLATCAEKSLDFGIGDPQSTSGFLVPTTFIFSANDVNPRDCFGSVRNASHEANLLSVAAKHVHVATANNRALYFRLKKNNPEAFKKLKEVWRSPLIAADPMAWRANLEPEIKAKLYYALMSFGRIGDPAAVAKEREILLNGGFMGFVPSSNSQLLPFREMEANKKILQIKGDETLSAKEKEAKIAEQMARIEEVRKLMAQVPSM